VDKSLPFETTRIRSVCRTKIHYYTTLRDALEKKTSHATYADLVSSLVPVQDTKCLKNAGLEYSYEGEKVVLDGETLS
jgi:hypothetical protein